jgi:hypothetical protein
MKIPATYTFNHTAKTVTFTGSTIPATLDKILAIINATSNVVIYNISNPSLGGTYSSPVLTLAYDTSAMADTDKLYVVMDDGNIYNSVLSVAGENHIGKIGGEENSVGVELTRPADTTAYTALDAISDSTSSPTVVFTFTNLSRTNGVGGYIVKALLLTDQKTCTSRFRLHLFDTAPTAINDNSPYLSLYANKATKLGTIDFFAVATEDPTNSTGASTQRDDIRLKYLPTGSSRTIYGLLETLDAFTPASGQKIYIKLSVENF